MTSRVTRVAVLLTVASVWLQAGVPLDSWHWRNPLPTGNAMVSVVFGPDGFVAAGENGGIGISSNGTNWTFRSALSGGGFWDLAYADGLCVAVGMDTLLDRSASYGVIAVSSDLKQWRRSEMRDLSALYSVAGSPGGTFVAVGAQGAILVSWDGLNSWVPQDSGTTADLFCVRNLQGKFFAGGDKGTLLISDDGFTWTKAAVPSDLRSVYAMAYGGDQYVAGGDGLLWTSPDGVQWTEVDGASGWIIRALSYGNRRFVGVGEGGLLLASSDAHTWIRCSAGTENVFLGVTYGGGSFVALGAGCFLISSNGTNWIPVSSGAAFPLADVVYGAKTIVAVGEAGHTLYCRDGTHWTNGHVGLAQDLHRVTYGQGRFVAVGREETIVSSTNGIDWLNGSITPITPGTSLISIAHREGLFLAGAENGLVLSSPNGLDWQQAARLLGAVSDITYGQGVFLAVVAESFASDTIMTSTDGTRWTAVFYPPTRVTAAVFGKGRFVVAGQQAIYWSTNAVDWQPSHWIPKYKEWTEPDRLCYGHGTFLAVGNTGTTMSSANGMDWSVHDSGTGNFLFGATYATNTFVAVGSGGAVLQSDPFTPFSSSLANLAILPNGSCAFDLNGPPGELWEIQATTDLANWQSLGSFISTNNFMRFTDPAASTNSKKYYRALIH